MEVCTAPLEGGRACRGSPVGWEAAKLRNPPPHKLKI